MFRKTGLIVLAAATFISGCCCWDQEEQNGAATGGLIGAGAGMLIGSMTGSWVWGGLIGGGLGALTGYVVADNAKDHRAREAETVSSASHSRSEADREFQVAMESRDSASAEKHLKRSIDIYPTPAAHNNLGLLQLQAGDRDSARASFRRAIVLDPSYDPALRNLEKLGA